MSDDAPKRILDDSPSRARELLSHAKSAPPLPLDIKAASAASVAKLASAKTGITLLVKLLAGGVLLAGLGIGGWFRSNEVEPVAAESSRDPVVAVAEEPGEVLAESPPTVAEEEEPTQSEPAEIVPNEPPVPRLRRPRPVRTQRPQAEHPLDEALPADSLAAEIALLEGARQSLRTSPAVALVNAQQHRRRFPRGQFSAAAELLEIDALLRLGRRAEAVERAREMARRRPSSLYRDRLVTLVGAEALR